MADYCYYQHELYRLPLGWSYSTADLELVIDGQTVVCFWSPLPDVAQAHWGPALNLKSAECLVSADWAWLAKARSLAYWHQMNRHCASCGCPTKAIIEPASRQCLGCHQIAYPRTDPAILARVRCRDKLLLVHQVGWPLARYSLIAGFVNPGENLATCVQREVAEEVNVSVVVGAYLGSQPWPFPANLMLAFDAWSDNEMAQADGLEIESCVWFSRLELQRALQSGQVTLPVVGSLSQRLIHDWLYSRC